MAERLIQLGPVCKQRGKPEWRQRAFGCSRFKSRLWHAPYGTTVPILSETEPSSSSHFEQSSGAILSNAAEHHTCSARVGVTRDGGEQGVRGRSVALE